MQELTISYTVLTSPNKGETAVHSSLVVSSDTLMSHYVPIADKKLRHADLMRIGSAENNLCICVFKHMVWYIYQAYNFKYGGWTRPEQLC